MGKTHCLQDRNYENCQYKHKYKGSGCKMSKLHDIKLQELQNSPWDCMVTLKYGQNAESAIWKIKDILQAENVRVIFKYPSSTENYFGLKNNDIFLEWIENRNQINKRFVSAADIMDRLCRKN